SCACGHGIAVAAGRALHRCRLAVDQNGRGERARQGRAACSGISLAGGCHVFDQYVGGARRNGAVSVAGERAGGGVVDAPGGFAGHTVAPCYCTVTCPLPCRSAAKLTGRLTPSTDNCPSMAKASRSGSLSRGKATTRTCLRRGS